MLRMRPRFWALLLLLASAAWAEPTGVTRGVTYERITRPEAPWSIDVVRVRRSPPWLGLEATLGRGEVLGRATLPDQLPPTTEAAWPVAAVNGDFFIMEGPEAGRPIGLHLDDGRVVHTGASSLSVFLASAGRIAVGESRLVASATRADGAAAAIVGINSSPPADGLGLYTRDWAATSPDVALPSVTLAVEGLPVEPLDRLRGAVREVGEGARAIPDDGIVLVGAGSGAEFLAGLVAGDSVEVSIGMVGVPAWALEAVSGGPMLVRGGEPVATDNPRHPRTAIGWNDREIILVTVDGRQPEWSIGMDFHELAALMLELGCTEALNLDGGGSTTCWVLGSIANRPSGGALRAVSNGLAVIEQAAVARP